MTEVNALDVIAVLALKTGQVFTGPSKSIRAQFETGMNKQISTGQTVILQDCDDYGEGSTVLVPVENVSYVAYYVVRDVVEEPVDG